MAMDSDGDFVITWLSGDNYEGQDGSSFGVYAQRYNAAGEVQGTEFQVNTYTTSCQSSPSIAMDADGDFVIAWTSGAYSGGQDGSSDGIYAQRYNAAGEAQGPEFQVNTYTTSSQFGPSIAMDGDGDFVIAWTSGDFFGDLGNPGQDGDGFGTYAQRYNATGVAQGPEFRINTFTTGSQRGPSIAMDNDGDFVITWGSYQDGSDYGIYAQRYNASGVVQGEEFQVNTYTIRDQDSPSIAMDSDGDFVITWESVESVGYSDGVSYSEFGIYAQRYNAAGKTQGSEFLVNTYTTNSQSFPSIAMDSDGDFVITWYGYGQDGPGYDVYAQRYNAAGEVQGTEFRVNTYTIGLQSSPSIAMDNNGDFVIAWVSLGQDGDGFGIFAQRYSLQTITGGIAPRPMSGILIYSHLSKVYINFPNLRAAASQVQIYDLSGKLHRHIDNSVELRQHLEIPVDPRWSAGVYLVKVVSLNQVTLHRVLLRNYQHPTSGPQ